METDMGLESMVANDLPQLAKTMDEIYDMAISAGTCMFSILMLKAIEPKGRKSQKDLNVL
uniref:Uncharacterized protein n=1 Tax=Tetranychus urticae TaxID=32264 RepID=T1KB25_TETUR